MTNSSFSAPIDDRYFEEYVDGAVHDFGPIAVKESEVVDFAKRFDPQPFHMNPELAKHSIYGGLIASGWHSASLMMRLFVEHYLSHVASLGSPGVDELRWLKPVRPGDTLRLSATVLESAPSGKQANRGTVLFRWDTLNQNGEVVLSMRGRQMFLRRAPAPV